MFLLKAIFCSVLLSRFGFKYIYTGIYAGILLLVHKTALLSMFIKIKP